MGYSNAQTDGFTKLLSTNSTDTSFSALAPTATEPTGMGVVNLSGRANPRLDLIFFGTDAANETFDCRLTGWYRTGTLWLPVVLAELEITLGARTGIAAQPVLNTEFLADTIALDAAYAAAATGFLVVPSTGHDLVAMASVLLRGASKAQFQFDSTGAASANLLYRLSDPI